MGLYHNFCRLQLGVSNPLHRYSTPASPSSLLFSFSSVRDGFVLMMEERSSQLRLERLQSSSLKDKKRRSTLVLRVALLSLAGALLVKAEWAMFLQFLGCLHNYVQDLLGVAWPKPRCALGCTTGWAGWQLHKPCSSSVLHRRGHKSSPYSWRKHLPLNSDSDKPPASLQAVRLVLH